MIEWCSKCSVAAGPQDGGGVGGGQDRPIEHQILSNTGLVPPILEAVLRFPFVAHKKAGFFPL